MARTIPDFDSSTDPANIRAILDYLDRVSDVPGPAIDALRGLLAQVERRDVPAASLGDMRAVVMPAHRRGEHERDVQLIEVTFTCRMCGKTQTITTYPGRKPNICQAEPGQKSSACQKEANRLRIAADRREKKAQKGQS